MIFGKFGFYFEGEYPEFSKILFSCIICMAPYYGLFYWWNYADDYKLIPFIGTVGGLNAIISYGQGIIESNKIDS
jgi:hypothetical protein